MSTSAVRPSLSVRVARRALGAVVGAVLASGLAIGAAPSASALTAPVRVTVRLSGPVVRVPLHVRCGMSASARGEFGVEVEVEWKDQAGREWFSEAWSLTPSVDASLEIPASYLRPGVLRVRVTDLGDGSVRVVTVRVVR